ncbi:MAG: IclR family transcriptional regulator [Burkholderiaceae bacterium]
MNDDSNRPVAAVERALTILDAFRSGDSELSLAELSSRTGLYKSTLDRLAITLERFGYLEKCSSGGYQLGATPLKLATLYRGGVQPAEAIMAIMRKLVDETGESATFSVRRGSLRICIYRVDSPHRLRDQLSVGDPLPFDRGAGGRVFRTFGTDAEPGARARLGKKLVVTATDEVVEGIAGIAAPVFDENGELHGALAISGPKFRLTREAMRRAEAPLLNAAYTLTHKLGGDLSAFEALTGRAASQAAP